MKNSIEQFTNEQFTKKENDQEMKEIKIFKIKESFLVPGEVLVEGDENHNISLTSRVLKIHITETNEVYAELAKEGYTRDGSSMDTLEYKLLSELKPWPVTGNGPDQHKREGEKLEALKKQFTDIK